MAINRNQNSPHIWQGAPTTAVDGYTPVVQPGFSMATTVDDLKRAIHNFYKSNLHHIGLHADLWDGWHATTFLTHLTTLYQPLCARLTLLCNSGVLELEPSLLATVPNIYADGTPTYGIAVLADAVALVTNGVARLTIDAEGKVTIPGLIDPTGLELTPVGANPGGTAANTLWADSGAGNRFKIGTNTVAYLSEVGTGDMLAANNLSDIASDDTALTNLIGGATTRVPVLDDLVPYLDDALGTPVGGKASIRNIFNLLVGVGTDTPVVTDDLLFSDGGASMDKASIETVLNLLTGFADDTPVLTDPFIFSDGGAHLNKATLQTLFNLINSLTEETTLGEADFLALYDASGSATDKVRLDRVGAQPKAKSGDQTYTSDNTMNNDNDFQWTVVSGGRYYLLIDADVTTGSTPDFQFDFNGGTATFTTCTGWFEATNSAGIVLNTRITDATTAKQILSTNNTYHLRVYVEMTINAGGTLIFRHAQVTSNGTATGLLKGSCARLLRAS